MKNQIQKAKKWLKSKKAFAVDTAIKVLTAVVLGALVLMGIYGVINGAVMPKTKEKIDSMYDIADAGVDMGGAGGGGALPGGGGAGGGTGGGGAGGGVGPTYNHDAPELHPGKGPDKTIPEGGKYISAKANFQQISTFPDVPTQGDIYTYKDYEYRYGGEYTPGGWKMLDIMPESSIVWAVKCSNNNIVSTTPILESIVGKPVACMRAAFFSFQSLTTVNALPNGIKKMDHAFAECPALTGTIEINSNLVSFDGCFYRAGSAPKSIVLMGKSNSLNALAATNAQGNVIVNVSNELNHQGIVPSGGGYFVGLPSNNPLGSYRDAKSSFMENQKFPEKVTDGDVYRFGIYEYRYNYRYQMVDERNGKWQYEPSQGGWGFKVIKTNRPEYTDKILESINGRPITNMDYGFAYCKDFTVAPTIPNTVKSMHSTFKNCTSLKGAVKINANPDIYINCFADAGSLSNRIILTGDSTKLSEIAATNAQGNVVVG